MYKSTATGIMQRELESINRYKSIIDAYEPLNCASMLAASSPVQSILGSMDSLKYIQDSIVTRASMGIADYDIGSRLASSQISSATLKAMESLSSLNFVKDSIALQRINNLDFFSDIQKRIGLSVSSSFQGIMDSFKGFDSIAESMTIKVSDALKKYEDIQKVFIPQNIAQQTVSSLMGLNSIQEGIGFRASAIQQAMETVQHMKLFEVPDSIAKTIEQLQSSGMLSKTIEALNRNNMFAQAVESFNSASYLSDFSTSISDFELSESISLIENANDDSFLDCFSKLSPGTQAIIIAIFVHFVLPVVLSIYANLMTPSVERVFKSGKMNIEQVRTIKNAPLPDIYTDNLRFITRTGEKLRSKPSTRSEALDELVIGQVFQVINKKKGWAEIEYSCEDEQVCRGWVLTTYTAKFKFKAKN